MECRTGCAACCIAPTISSMIPGMPDGKTAGTPCINLDDQLNCKIWQRKDYPGLCSAFKADSEHCGTDRDQALLILSHMESETAPPQNIPITAL